MENAYYNLKSKLRELGYNSKLPADAVPLVECILADLVQTTRSLQRYMEMSKEALKQRDSMMLEAEPYRCENAKLIKENNHLNKELMELKEENQRIVRESKRKVKSLSEELAKKDAQITKLQHDLRDLSLRGLSADTYSTRNKSRRKDAGDSVPMKKCVCEPKQSTDTEISELKRIITALEDNNEALQDEVTLLRNQIEHRDNEILRLNILLEGGRPITAIAKDCCKVNTDTKVVELLKDIKEIEHTNELLKKEIDSGLEKQHEAMQRALHLAEKNKLLQDELKKVDLLALKVEDDCNDQLASMKKELSALQTKVQKLTVKNVELEKELLEKQTENSYNLNEMQDSLKKALKEKKELQNEVRKFSDINKSLSDRVDHLTQELLTINKNVKSDHTGNLEDERKRYENRLKNTQKNLVDSINSFVSQLKCKDRDIICKKCPSKDELRCLLEKERRKYENNLDIMQKKLTDFITSITNELRNKDKDPKSKNDAHENEFIKDLHVQLCETEQKLLMLKKENDEYKAKLLRQDEEIKRNYKDIISQLNVENAELTKENIELSQKLSQNNSYNRSNEQTDQLKREINELKDKILKLTNEMQILRKDRQEYKTRYNEALDSADKLRRNLALKQKEVEHLQEENSSYKMTSRSGKASAEHLKEECHFLREQIKRIQSDVIKEKTIASQIKNIQIETERSTNEIQNELLCTQKKLSLSKDTIDSLERKCKDLQSNIITLQNDKSNLIEKIKKVDQERDKLVIDLDRKTETICVLERKLKSRSYEISKLENEIAELKRYINNNKVIEHQLTDNESQIAFLNGEIARMQQKLDTALMENKHLQNSLADANANLKLNKNEYDKSRREVEGLKQQLQHYVAEIRRIEELLSHKEAERSEMLEHFASLSVEANILENTNHSLENESASKSHQLQNLISTIEDLKEKLHDKEQTIEQQSTRIANMTCKTSTLENEIKLLTEEKSILEQNVSYLKKMCSSIQKEHESLSAGLCDTDSELKLFENRVKNLTKTKEKLEVENQEINHKLATTEQLLSNARREIIELKLALQDATSETKSLQNRVTTLTLDSSSRFDAAEPQLTREELELPLMLEETIHEVSHEEDVDSSRYHEVRKRYSKYTHGSTL